jgi:hypothetical protein
MAEKRYDAFKGLDLSNARNKNETREEYKERLSRNKHVLKLYETLGRDRFKELFPKGVSYDLFEPTEKDIAFKKSIEELSKKTTK